MLSGEKEMQKPTLANSKPEPPPRKMFTMGGAKTNALVYVCLGNQN